MPLEFLFTTPGNYTIEDNGVPGDGISVVKDGTGTVIFTFAHPADSLRFFVDTPGVNITINFTDTLGAANFTVGVLDDPAQSPASITVRSVETSGIVTLVSNGAIIEGGSDAAADIVAGQLIMSAETGVGSAGNALETQVAAVEAETDTGGINIANTGDVQIGSLSDFVDGLDVATSGNIVFTNIGSIFLGDDDVDAGNPLSPFETVHGGATSGNVNLTATGISADLIGSTDLDSIAAPRGSITLTAGRDIALGTAGTNFDNDVRANGSVTINAGRDFLADGFADVASDGFGNSTAGSVIINVGRNFHLRSVTGTDASVTAEGNAGGDVIVTTGSGGAVILDTPAGPETLRSISGDVILNADRMLISGVSGIRADNGQVNLRPATVGREIILGSVSDAALALELSDAELDTISTPTLVIGSNTAGNLSVVSAISPTTPTSLTLQSGFDISIQASIAALLNLSIRAGDDLSQAAASAITAGGALTIFVDQVQSDGGIGGVATMGGTVTAAPVTINGDVQADNLTGANSNDTLNGNGSADTLVGGAGNDTLVGGTGLDTATGGLGDDIFVVDMSSDVSIEAVGEGNDTVQSPVNYTIGANIENLTLTGAANVNGTGNALNNNIIGNTGNNVLNGAAGVDMMFGGLGDDTYVVDDTGDKATEVSALGGTDIVMSSATFTLGSNVENLSLTGAAAVNATGNAQDNIINGNVSQNVLNGLGGADTLAGGLSHDTYVIDALDTLIELPGGGVDTVQVNFTYTLLAEFENLILTGAAAINGTGNSVNNIITGNIGANILTGGGGVDSLVGGTGNDTYVIDSSDGVTELAGGGVDTVQADFTYALLAEFENLTLTGAADINGTGNSVANVITGNSGANLLNGAGGADTMFGGLGNDTYFVETIGDVATETSPAGGDDHVMSSITFSLGGNVERLTLTGGGNINGTGNTIANTIFGNGGNNVLDGGAGGDLLRGGLGNDTYVIDDALDVIDETTGGGGVDTVMSAITFTLSGVLENLTLIGGAAINGTGNAFANVLIGNIAANSLSGGAGADSLTGMGGADTLTGGSGDDTYFIDGLDTLVELAGGGTDTVNVGFSYTLLAQFENLTLTGALNIAGTGNGVANVVTGNSGNNTLNGMAGADTMFGGLGDDTYHVDDAGDDATELSAVGGNDIVMSSVSFTIAANVERLTLTGAASINGTGNTLDNLITGNTGNNVLTGGLGADTLNGNTGNDTYRYAVETESTAASRDSITAFNAGDLIDLALIDANGAGAGNGAFTFIGAAAFSGTAGELRATLVGAEWIVEGDVNGDAVADLVIGVTSGAYVISGTDFAL